VQQLNFQLGDSDFFAGVRQRFFVADAQFDAPSSGLGIVPDEFQSKTSGLGAGLAFDSRDQPFCPRRGGVADVSYLRYASALGGDFDYGRLEAYVIRYVPLGAEWTIGVNASGQFLTDDAPFYDLARISMRGVSADQFMDDDAVQLEGELRWDFVERWSAVAFGGVGRVAGSLADLGDAGDSDDVWSAGTGFRYLLARQFGMRVGIDLARGPDDTAVYLTIGTGWFRP
jgi:outer membrane protein assembly factor BamA